MELRERLPVCNYSLSVRVQVGLKVPVNSVKDLSLQRIELTCRKDGLKERTQEEAGNGTQAEKELGKRKEGNGKKRSRQDPWL